MPNEHKPTAKSRERVDLLAMVGASARCIAREMGLDERTLKKHYATELEDARERAVTNVAGALYRKAMSGDPACMMFFLKTQGRQHGWIEKEKDDQPSATSQLDVVKSVIATIAMLRGNPPSQALPPPIELKPQPRDASDLL